MILVVLYLISNPLSSYPFLPFYHRTASMKRCLQSFYPNPTKQNKKIFNYPRRITKLLLMPLFPTSKFAIDFVQIIGGQIGIMCK